MASLAELLTRAISSVQHPSEAQAEILDRLSALRWRFEEGLLRVAVLGQFKRGKSTLLNALLGARVLPTGVTPVTALPTFISAGETTRLRIAFRGGKEPPLTAVAADIPGVLERYVSETQNPHNRFEVESVAVEVRSDFLDEGIVLIDTPGVGSTFLHNTRAAEAVLSECDAALFVLSVDPPITEAEVRYLDKVRKLIPSVFFVLNKVDLLDAAERGVAERFLAGVLAERRPTEPSDRIFALSAKQGLQAKLTNDAGSLAASGLPRLERLLAGELARDKRAILVATGRLRLTSLVSELLFQCELERKALLTPEEELKRKAATFEASVANFEANSQQGRQTEVGQPKHQRPRAWVDGNRRAGRPSYDCKRQVACQPPTQEKDKQAGCRAQFSRLGPQPGQQHSLPQRSEADGTRSESQSQGLNDATHDAYTFRHPTPALAAGHHMDTTFFAAKSSEKRAWKRHFDPAIFCGASQRNIFTCCTESSAVVHLQSV